MRIVSREEARRLPWKNGRGTTLELVTDATTPDGEWTYRLAIADVPQPGPFSSYPGIERVLVLVSGDALDLERDGVRLPVPSVGHGITFPGEAAVVGHPSGADVRDANLMVRRDTWQGTLEVVGTGEQSRAGDVVLVHAIEGRVESGNAVAVSLSQGETLVARERLSFLVHGRAVVAVLARR